jgi:chorismate-pyruvate lyase
LDTLASIDHNGSQASRLVPASTRLAHLRNRCLQLTMHTPSQRMIPDLDTLIGLFYDAPERLGQFAEVDADEMPDGYRALLAHDEHMTVAIEAHYAEPVDVRVLDRVTTGSHYARKILLARRSDGGVVQFGIMQVDFAYLEAPVRDEIRRENTPLGRILVRNDVLRRVRLSALWRVAPGEDLLRSFALHEGAVTYGRTALIECNGQPAVRLLEIVAPLVE